MAYSSVHTFCMSFCSARMKVKGGDSSLWEAHLKSHGASPAVDITQCYLPPNTGECTQP